MNPSVKLACAELCSKIDVGSIVDKPKVIAIAIGLAVASRLGSFPSSAVDNPGEHYVSNQSVCHGTAIYDFNEAVIFNRDLAVSIARAYWRYRYGIIYSHYLPSFGNADFFSSITNVGFHFQPDDIAFMNQYALQITSAANKFIDVLNEIHGK